MCPELTNGQLTFFSHNTLLLKYRQDYDVRIQRAENRTHSARYRALLCDCNRHAPRNAELPATVEEKPQFQFLCEEIAKSPHLTL
jgi:hypothetical protein